MHETIGKSDEWYTPPIYFEMMNTFFDLDPCSPGLNHWVPTNKVYTKKDNGLIKKWEGFVFMNPPFGGRNGITPWLDKFFNHGNGIGVAPARTSCGWFQKYMVKSDILLFPEGKTKFWKPDGSIGKSPSTGVVLFGSGKQSVDVLSESEIGLFFKKHVT